MPTKTLIYIGRRLAIGNTLKPFYLEEGTTQTYGYKKPLLTGIRVGARLEATYTEDGNSVMTGGENAPRLLGQVNDDQTMAWAAEEAVAVTQHARILEAKRAADGLRDPLREHIDALREAYQRLPGGFGHIGTRAAFIDYITTAIQS